MARRVVLCAHTPLPCTCAVLVLRQVHAHCFSLPMPPPARLACGGASCGAARAHAAPVYVCRALASADARSSLSTHAAACVAGLRWRVVWYCAHTRPSQSRVQCSAFVRRTPVLSLPMPPLARLACSGVLCGAVCTHTALTRAVLSPRRMHTHSLPTPPLARLACDGAWCCAARAYVPIPIRVCRACSVHIGRCAPHCPQAGATACDGASRRAGRTHSILTRLLLHCSGARWHMLQCCTACACTHAALCGTSVRCASAPAQVVRCWQT